MERSNVDAACDRRGHIGQDYFPLAPAVKMPHIYL
jgi:hypothetical protein